MYQVQKPLERGRIRIRRSWAHATRTRPGPARFGSARARACGDVAHGPTLITIGMGEVDIYITQSPISYLMCQIRGKLKFSLQLKYIQHISHACISNIGSNVCVCVCVFCHIHLSCPYQCNLESNMLKQYNTAHIFEILVIEFNDLL